jgi:L-fuconolactonase
MWNPGTLRYAWLEDLPVLNRSFLIHDYARVSAGTGVTKMVFIECGRDSEQALDEVDWISRLAETEPRLRGIVAHACLEKGAEARADLAMLASRPLVKGVRRLLQGEREAGYCLRPDFVAGVCLLAEYGYTFDLCIRHEQLPDATELARRVPEVRFVLDHFGKPPVKAGAIEPWADRLKVLSRLPNVCCKISGLTTEADWRGWTVGQLRPYFEIALEAFGNDRVMFGSDWPVSTLATGYARWIEAVMEIASSIPGTDPERLFSANAEAFYGV